MHKNFALVKSPDRVLLIVMRYLGDVLLTTPLISSLHQAYKSAKIDVLVFENTAGILEGNPDINKIITIANRPTLTEQLYLYKNLFRKYDLAICTQTGDRPSIAALFAAANRIGAVPQRDEKGWWKRNFFHGWVEFDNNNTHTVLQHLKLAAVLGIPLHFLPTPPTKHSYKNPVKKHTKYAIVHPHPKWHYKRWSIERWRDTGHYFDQLGIQIVLTGSSAAEEINYIQEIHNQLPKNTINLAGKLSLAELSSLISQAKIFIGPDTGITHLAAATGIPTIAIFGPSNPVKWAPWPYNYQSDSNPFQKIGSQHVGNIFLIQGPGDCVPCYLEGCEKHRLSHSKCLDTLAFSEIKQAINQSLNINVSSQ
jgi:heptosyltransferase-3